MKFFAYMLLINALFCLTPMSATAQEATIQQVVSALEQSYTGLKDMQAAFSQSTTLPGLPKPQKGNGELLLRRPDKGAAQFRFDYASPKQQIVSNGRQLWFYQPENRQVIVTSVETMMKSGGNLAMAYLTGLGNVSKDFSAAFAKEAKDKNANYQIELTPRNPSPALSKLRLTISKEIVENPGSSAGFPIVSSVLIDSNGTETRIDYSKVRINRGMSSSRFNFKIPEGTEIIKQ